MHELFKTCASYVSLGLDGFAVLVIAIGGVRAMYHIALGMLGKTTERRRDVWVRFGGWLLIGLEFELGADVIDTVVAPTWVEIGQLAAIAVIRTFLNYFLGRDLEDAEKLKSPAVPEA